MIDLRCGDWRDVLADVECDALICDPPYGARTHSGHDAGKWDTRKIKERSGSKFARRSLNYSNWTEPDVRDYVAEWSPRCRGWFVAMSCSNLSGVWRQALEDAGRCTFAPVSCVIPGMTVRLTGDGPSSWTIWLNVARPRSRGWSSWGTLPGSYTVRRRGCDAAKSHIGGKPIELMNAIIRDYTRPGDLVCDPTAGMATTAIACSSLGRRFVGAEIDPETYAKAQKRLAGGQQMDMFGGVV